MKKILLVLVLTTLLVGFLVACTSSKKMPEVNNFKASNSSVNSGDEVTLTWSVSGKPDSITINPGNIDVTGKTSYKVKVNKTTTYTITVKNSEGENKGTIEVKVEPINVSIDFKAKVGNTNFSCNRSFQNIGTTNSTATLTDFRFYVHDATLIKADGSEAKVALTQDGKWQKDNIVLLDFEDGTGSCSNGNSDTNTSIKGTVPAGDYTSVKFKLGVPFEMNHQLPESAPSPLNLTSLFWVWNAGYKFVRIDLKTQGQPDGWFIHLGSTGCNGASRTDVPTSCANPNRPEITLNNFNASDKVIVADVKKLLMNSDVDSNVPDSAKGCMSGPTDTDCIGVFNNFGLPFDGKDSTGQTFFSVVDPTQEPPEKAEIKSFTASSNHVGPGDKVTLS